MPLLLGARCPSSTLLPFSVWGPLIKTEYYEKGYPYDSGVTGAPRGSTGEPRNYVQGAASAVDVGYVGKVSAQAADDSSNRHPKL